MPETRARDIADLGGDATSLATDAELTSGLALKADTTALAPKVDYELTANAQNGSGGSAYTFVLADARRLTTATNAAAKTFLIPPQSSVEWADNSIIRVVNYGAGVLTIAGGSGVTVTNAAKTLAQYESAAVIRTGSNAWTLVPFSGGDFPAATVSGGTVVDYTEGGVTWRQHELRSSGSLTVTKAGYVDTLLLIAGGGNAGLNSGQFAGGGGGGGGFFLRRWSYLQPQTISATIGGATQNSSAVIQGYGTIPGNTIICGAGANGGGGGSGGGGGVGFGGNAGSNGGGSGGSGGGGAAPGWSATGGGPTIVQTLGYPFFLRGVSFGNGGGGGANTGNGADAGSNGAGGSGVLIIRYPLISS